MHVIYNQVPISDCKFLDAWLILFYGWWRGLKSLAERENPLHNENKSADLRADIHGIYI